MDLEELEKRRDHLINLAKDLMAKTDEIKVATLIVRGRLQEVLDNINKLKDKDGEENAG